MMDTVRLGLSGLQVSPIVLGCVSFGEPTSGVHSWTLTEADSRPIIEQALEAGVTTFDTANNYSAGMSEEIVGRAIADFARRDEVIIATKLFDRVRPGPGGAGLSRKAILTSVDDSLRRLNTDYIDLYQIHRWDSRTPVEETMAALHDIVRAGKVRYLGASSMYAWQLAKAQYTADLHGWTRFIAMQNQYNLVQREDEREMLPFCSDQGVGVIPWSPLARGRLARDWDDESSPRGRTDKFTQHLYGRQDQNANRAIAAAVLDVASDRGVSRAQVALAWVRQQHAVTAPIIGATKPQHLAEAIASLDLELSRDEMDQLEAPYTPRPPEGF